MKLLARRKRSSTEASSDDGSAAAGHEHAADHPSPAVVKPPAPPASASRRDGLVRSGGSLRRGGSSFRLRGSRRSLAREQEEDEDDGTEEYEHHAPSKTRAGVARRKSRLSDIRSSICSILSSADTVVASNNFEGGCVDCDDISGSNSSHSRSRSNSSHSRSSSSRFGGLKGSGHSRRSLLPRGSSLKRPSSFRKPKQASYKKPPSIRFEPSVLEATDEHHAMASARWALRRQSTEHTLSTLGTASTRSTLSSLTGGSSLRSLNTVEHAASDAASLASKPHSLTLPQIGEGGECEEGGNKGSGSPPTSPRLGARQAQHHIRGLNRRGTLTSIPDGIDCIVVDPDRGAEGRGGEGDSDHATDGKSVCSDLTGFTGAHSALQHEQPQPTPVAGAPAEASTAAAATTASASQPQQPQHPQPHRPVQSRRGSIERPAAMGRRRSSLIRIPDGIALAEFEFEEDGDDGTECSELTFPTVARSTAAAGTGANRRGSIELGAGGNTKTPGTINRRGSIEVSSSPQQPRPVHARRGSLERPTRQSRRGSAERGGSGQVPMSRRGSVERGRPAAQGRRRSSLVRIPDGIALELAQFDDDDDISAFGNDSVSSEYDLNLSASDLEMTMAAAAAVTDFGGFDLAAAQSPPVAVKDPPTSPTDHLKDDSGAYVPRDVNHNSIRTEDMRPARAGRRRSSLFRIPDDARILAENEMEEGSSTCSGSEANSISVGGVSGSGSVRESSCPQLRGISSTQISDLPNVPQACLSGNALSSSAPPSVPASVPSVPARVSRRYRRSSLDSMMDDESVTSVISYQPSPSQVLSYLSRRHSLESAQEDDVVSRSIIDDAGPPGAKHGGDDDDVVSSSSDVEAENHRVHHLPDEIGDTQREEAMLESDAFQSDDYLDGEESITPSLALSFAPSLALSDMRSLAPSVVASVASAAGVARVMEQSLTLLQATAPQPEPIAAAAVTFAPTPMSSASSIPAARSSVLDRLQNLDHRRAAQDAAAASHAGRQGRRGSSASSPGTVSTALAAALASQAAAASAMGERSAPNLLRPSTSSASLSILDRLQQGSGHRSTPDILDRIQSATGQQGQQSLSTAASSSVFDRIQSAAQQQGNRTTSSILDRIQAQATSAPSATNGSRSTSSLLGSIQGGGQSTSSILDRIQAQASARNDDPSSAASAASSHASVLDRIQGGSQSTSSILDRLQSQQASSTSLSVLDRIQGSRSTSSIFDRLQSQQQQQQPSTSAAASSVLDRTQGSQSTSSILDRLQSQQTSAPAPPAPSVLDRMQGSQSTSSILDRLQSQQPSPSASTSSILDRIQGGSQSTSSILDRIQNQQRPAASILDRIQASSQGQGHARARAQSMEHSRQQTRFAAPPTVLGAPRAAAASSTAATASAPSNAAPRSVLQHQQAPSSSASVSGAPAAASAASASTPARRTRTGSAPGSMLANSAAAVAALSLIAPQDGNDDGNDSSSSIPSALIIEAGPPTALYNAVSACAPYQTIRSLLEANPSHASRQNGGGLTPLHCAIERYDTPINILAMLLEADPTVAALRNRRGHTPLDLLWKRFVEPELYRSESARTEAATLHRMMENAVSDDALGSDGKSERRSSSESQDKPCHKERARKARAIRALYSSAELREFWELLKAFVRAAHTGALEDDGDNMSSYSSGMAGGRSAGRWRLLHAAAAIGSPPLLLRFASALNPDHIRLGHGPTSGIPLHHFAASTRIVEDAVASSTARTLLALHPASAATPDGTGRLPLSLAAESRRPWGALRALFLSNPSVLTTPDAATGMLPFMTAAAGSGADANVVFRLIRENPLELTRGISPS